MGFGEPRELGLLLAISLSHFLHTQLLFFHFQIQASACDSKVPITEEVVAVHQLCTAIEKILKDGLQKKHRDSESFWPFVREFSRHEVVTMVRWGISLFSSFGSFCTLSSKTGRRSIALTASG